MASCCWSMPPKGRCRRRSSSPQKALALGLRPIVVLNKVDKPDAEPDRALDEVFDLFAALDANEDQLDFPHLYASGRAGWADAELDGPRKDLSRCST
jgi:GTP-binding protein